MRKNWTKAECRQLRAGNIRLLRRWVQEHADSFYTWVVRHYLLSLPEAQERAVQLLKAAYSAVSEYEPASGSMYRWLLERAAAVYAPETNWDSLRNLPKADEILAMLARIGTQDFPEDYLENPLVVHLVQAALTEMERPHRQILLSCYYRIDTEGAALTGRLSSSEEMEEELVRARYYFRRYLLGWIQSLSPVPPKVSDDIQIQIFERNLEKIFRSVPPLLKLPQESRQMLEDALLQEAEFRHSGTAFEKVFSKKTVCWGVGVLFLILVLVVLGYYWRPNQSDVQDIVPHRRAAVGSKKSEAKEVDEKKLSAEELKVLLNQVFAAGSAGDIGELLRVLETGPYPAQVAAAVFLGRLGDAGAIGPLEKASRRWFSDSRDEDPFLLAIEQIERRLKGAVVATEAEPEIVVLGEPNALPAGEAEKPAQEKPSEAVPVLSPEESRSETKLEAAGQEDDVFSEETEVIEPNQPPSEIIPEEEGAEGEGVYEEEPSDMEMDEEETFDYNQTEEVQYEFPPEGFAF